MACPARSSMARTPSSVYTAVKAAADRARAGDGPTLIEFKTYRYKGHSRNDTAPYRPAGELDALAETRSDHDPQRAHDQPTSNSTKPNSRKCATPPKSL